VRTQTTPLLESAEFSLRPIELSDIDAWYEYLSMPHVVEQTSWSLASAEALRPLIDWYNADDPSSAIRFAIQAVSSERLVGTVGFHTVSVPHRTAELAYDLHPSYWGRGLASACCRATTAWGFSQQHYVRVQATVLETNARSVRVLERCHFSCEGMLRSYRMVRGEPRDFWMYARIAGAEVAGS
jgi:RimJ/RimL family protein N-acetyltransferase